MDSHFKQIAERTLTAVYPKQFALLDTTQMAALLQGACAGESLTESDFAFSGRRNELFEILKLLFSAATFIKTALDIYEYTRRSQGRKPSEDEVIAAIPPEMIKELGDDASKRLLEEVDRSG